MINEDVTARVLELMQELAAIDPQAVRLLIEARVPCNYTLAAHPSVQVGRIDGDHPMSAICTYEVGLLGILNGLCGTYDAGPRQGWGPITAVLEGDGSIRFQRTEEAA